MKKNITLLFSVFAIVVSLIGITDYTAKIGADTVNNPETEKSDFEKAVEIIKKYEGMHSPKHYPLVGYGHLVLPGEKYSRTKALSEREADALLRKDLLKNCAVFREYGKDSLILGVLAYNIGSGNVKRSSVTSKLKAGNRDIRSNYLAHCRYKGKELPQLKRRRTEEFNALFINDNDTASSVKTPSQLASVLFNFSI